MDRDSDVDQAALELSEIGISVSTPQYYPDYAPDYYVFFRDPDGILLEVTNFRDERKKRFEEWN